MFDHGLRTTKCAKGDSIVRTSLSLCVYRYSHNIPQHWPTMIISQCQPHSYKMFLHIPQALESDNKSPHTGLVTSTKTFVPPHHRLTMSAAQQDANRIQATIISDLSDSNYFTTHFSDNLEELGSGADGLVLSATHKATGRLVAVKIPLAGKFWTDDQIRAEAKVLANIGTYGKHANVAHMLAYQPDFGEFYCPAIFSEVAAFGNLLDYRDAWKVQEASRERSFGIAEATVWKLFKDMILALDYLHNECGFIHRDVKPENILVTLPPGYEGSLIPTLPLFRLCDFSRAVAYPSPKGVWNEWAGTIDFAPPLRERAPSEYARPAGDMWSLGATLQEFALGISPLQSRQAFAANKKKRGEWCPRLRDEANWKTDEWKHQFTAVYRPLNMSPSGLRDWYDVVKPMATSYVPFSETLDKWYVKLWDKNWDRRVTSASLVECLVPLIDDHIGINPDEENEEEEKRRTDSVLAAQTQRNGGEHHVSCTRKVRHRDFSPSYEGNGYPSLSSELLEEIEE